MKATSAARRGGVADTSQGLRQRVINRGVQALGIGTFYLVVLVYFAISAPHFVEYSNALNILSNVSVIGIVAIGQTMVIVSGGFDLSVGAAMPLGAVVFAKLINNGIGVPEAVLVVILVGVTIGLVNGLIITKIGINPLIATLAMLSIGVGLAFTVTNGVTLPLENMEAGFWGNEAIAGVSYQIVMFIALSLLAFLVLRFTVFGRQVYATGGNREAARLAGIRVNLVTLMVYVISGALAALAGQVVASQLLAGSPTIGSDAPLVSIAAVILGGAALTGGVGSIVGTLLGVLVLGTIANGMALMQIPPFYQQIATGAVLLMAVGFGRLRAIVGSGQ